MVPHSLDNPVWHALTGPHAGFSLGDGVARRYRPAITTIGAMREPGPAGYAALATIAQPGEEVALGLVALDELSPGWVVEAEKPMLQMVLDRPAETPAPEVQPVELGAADVPDVLALVDLTHPGPFGPEALRLGRFIGVREHGRLIAMAGERFRLPGYCEVSGVCTHPDAQGRGLARALMNHIAAGIQRRGEVAFLHVIEANTRAAGLYARMGYVTRRRLWYRAVRRYN